MRLRELSSSLRRPAIRPETGQLVGWILVAAASVITVRAAATNPVRPIIAAKRDLFLTGQLLAAGVVAAAAVALFRKYAPRKALLAYAAIALASLALSAPALREDVSVRAGKLPLPYGLAVALLIAAIAAVVPLSALLGRALARPWIYPLGVAAGVGLAVANHLVLPDDYPGVHLVASIAAATLAGAALASSEAPESGRIARIVSAVLAALGLAAVVIPPGNSVGLALSRVPGDVVAPWLARLREIDDSKVDLGDASAKVAAAAQDGWFKSRAGRPAVPPSSPPVLPENPIVILFVVDAMRADLLEGDKQAAALPAFTALKRMGTQFREVRATAPATAPSVSAIMSGRYYSQLYWSQWPGATAEWVYPHLDETPRLPELLAKAGVDTTIISGMPGFVASYGVVKGFAEERVIKGDGHGYADARAIMAPVIARIGAQKADRPLFLYVHVTDAHAPYDHGKPGGTPFERYLRGVKRVDAELARLVAKVDGDPGLRDRTVIIATADHGEAFLEHGSNFHATTLYEEMIRVPLIVRLPDRAARVVPRPASLLDLTPTILDLFAQPAPGEMMGQSLVPFLRGEDATLTRPIVSDSSRLMRSLVFPDGYKIIHDRRRGTVELYDLKRDPRERRDIFEESGPDGAARLRALKAFFNAHTLKRPGYKVPYGR